MAFNPSILAVAAGCAVASAITVPRKHSWASGASDGAAPAAATVLATAAAAAPPVPRPPGRVGVFLDEASAAALQERFPKFRGSRFILLEGRGQVGTGVYEPLYGVVTNCRVTNIIGSPDVDAVSE